MPRPVLVGEMLGALCHAKGPLCWHWVTGQGPPPPRRCGRKPGGKPACAEKLEEDGRLMVFNPLNPDENGGPPRCRAGPQSRLQPSRASEKRAAAALWASLALCSVSLQPPGSRLTRRGAARNGDQLQIPRAGSGLGGAPRSGLGGADPAPRGPASPGDPEPGVSVPPTKSSVEPGRTLVVGC